MAERAAGFVIALRRFPVFGLCLQGHRVLCARSLATEIKHHGYL
jgi:hypothetical protein